MALTEDGGRAEAARAELARAGWLSLERVREIRWEGLRSGEGKKSARRGHDYAADERPFRRGYEWEQAHHQRLMGESSHEDEQGGQPSAPPARDPTEPAPDDVQPAPTPPGDESQSSASLEGLPPSSNPANWVDHED